MRTISFTFAFLFTSLNLLNAQENDTVCVIEEIEANSVLNVFPNPTTGIIQITYGSISACPPAGWGGILLINIINSDGKTVYTEAIHEFEGEYSRSVDLSNEKRGEYIIEVVAGKQKKVKREILN